MVKKLAILMIAAVRAIISVFGLTWCWSVRRTGSIWSAWIAHMVLDWLVDPFTG
jgi:membrane protease YdiL (CAAX protease family)